MGDHGLDPKTGETQWYNYNDCVSLENWAVLDRLLKTRFGWMELTDPALVIEPRCWQRHNWVIDNGEL